MFWDNGSCILSGFFKNWGDKIWQYNFLVNWNVNRKISFSYKDYSYLILTIDVVDKEYTYKIY